MNDAVNAKGYTNKLQFYMIWLLGMACRYNRYSKPEEYTILVKYEQQTIAIIACARLPWSERLETTNLRVIYWFGSKLMIMREDFLPTQILQEKHPQ